MVNLQLWIEACQQLQIPFQVCHRDFILLEIEIEGKKLYFEKSVTPFNSQVIAQICKDKDLTYTILKNKINIPYTQAYIDPHLPEKYQHLVNFANFHQIASDIVKNFSLPVIIKKNHGSLGTNVFDCETEHQVFFAVRKIFSDHKNYDFVLLAQEKIQIKTEFRAIFYRFKKQGPKLVLLYEKNIENAEFVGNISPLHWKNSRAIKINDLELQLNMENFAKPIFEKIDVNFVGLDISLDKKGKMYLIEMNSNPSFGMFVRDNGGQEIVKIFMEILKDQYEKKEKMARNIL